MKVRIHKYPTWVGVYQIVYLLQKVGVSEDTCYKIAKKVDTKLPQLNKFCRWVQDKRVKKDQIIIEPFDTWSGDYTLAKIIIPVLEQLKRVKHGAPYIDNNDVPEKYRTEDSDPDFINDAEFQARWDYVLDRMIEGFRYVMEEDRYLHLTVEEQVERDAFAAEGRRLFAKYYGALWD